MAFNDLQLKVAAESAVQASHANMARLSLFAKSFSELDGKYGQAVPVPVYSFSDAGDFVAGTNDYGTGSNEVDGAVITLNKHIVKSVSITDRQLAETGINWVKDTSTALTNTITKGVNKYVFGLINSTNVSAEEEVTLSTKSAIANLYSIAATADIGVNEAVVALNPVNFALVLSQLDANVYGGSEAVRLGVIPGLYGFKGFVCTSFLPSGTTGAIIAADAIGIASRYLAPGTEGAYPEAWAATDEDGFTIGARRFMDLNQGADKFAMDCLFGAKILQASKIIRLADVTPESEGD